MKVARFNPNVLTHLPESYQLLDKFFNEGLNLKRDLTSFRPLVDVIETEAAFQLQVALPGFKKENIKLDFEESKLTISGERKFEAEKESHKYHFLETNYGSFTRTFTLPETIQDGAIEARFEDGLLTVVLPKVEKVNLKRQIEVK
ncbi:MAG: Hsp20/alpha crystallin family protein [Adhaeribacter sp.]